ncbi:MAG: TetR/AcrR family transcriptional regulator [Ruminococcaceae bacterium]|nr:TetR/AcrR family transcriptional regulator [Oscillospiraceae bacterium]
MDLRKKRIVRTKTLLKSTFIALMESRSPHEITVVELCRAARLNRSSFYAHYGYMDDLIRDIVFDCVAEVCDSVNRSPLDMTEDGGIHRRRIAIYLDAFLSNDTLRRLCTCEDSDLFRADIVSAHVKITLGSQDDPKWYYPAYFQNTGVLNLILEWLKSGMNAPKEHIIEIIHQFSKAMYYPYEY